MRRIITAACAALTMSAVSACASNPSPDYESASPRSEQDTSRQDERIQLHVNNQNFLAVTVRAISGSQDQRLGTVESGREETFDVPRTISPLDLRFSIDPIGSGDAFTTEKVIVTEGADVEMDVRQSLELTTVTVNNR